MDPSAKSITTPTQLQLSVDLIGQTINHLRFLKAIEGNHFLRNKDVMKRAIYRYEKYWLPLAAEHPHEYLSAPMDIEWVWHCHMLSPEHYEEDCYKIVGRTINHTVRRPEEYQVARNNAHAFWTKKYQIAFYIDHSETQNDDEGETHDSVISYDIIAAAEKQHVFYYQVSLPHYQDMFFLEQAVIRYKQFLFLKRKHPDECLVPCYDIDVIWHTHQLNPVQYKQDTSRILGHLLSNADSINESVEGLCLNATDEKIRELWKTNYSNSFARCGAMYRGKPPNYKLHAITEKDALFCCTQLCSISMDVIVLNLPTPDLNRNKHLSLKVSSSTATRKTISDWFKLKRPSSVPTGVTSITWTNVGSFGVNTIAEHGVLFSLLQKQGTIKSTKLEIGANFMNLIPHIVSTGPTGKPLHEKLQVAKNAFLNVQGHINPPHIGDAILKLSSSSSYETRDIPDDIHSLLGPISLENLPSNVEKHTCQEATHTLTNHLGFEAFKVRMFHSTSLMTSVIHVCYRGKMAAIAHVIAADQIPLPTQIRGDTLCLNPKQGERAVLIKNNDGDWGIVVGYWYGLGREVSPTQNTEQMVSNHGTLRVRFYKISTGEMYLKELGYNHVSLQNPFVFSAESFRVDLQDGKIQIDPSSHELVENVACIFSVALLHVLCVPRSKDWKPGSPLNGPEPHGPSTINQIPSDSLALIKAAGVHVDTPSNHYIFQNFGSKHCATFGGDEAHLPINDEWERLPEGGFGDSGFREAYNGGCEGGGINAVKEDGSESVGGEQHVPDIEVSERL